MKTIVFHPDVFIFSDQEAYLLYNSTTYDILEINHNSFWDRIFPALNQASSLYRFSVPETVWANNSLALNGIIKGGFADVYDSDEPIPFSYAPIPKFDVDLSTIQSSHDKREDGFILSFVRHITFILDGHCIIDRLDPLLNYLSYCPLISLNVSLVTRDGIGNYSSLFHRMESICDNCHFYIQASFWSIEAVISFSHLFPNWHFHICGLVKDVSPYSATFPLQISVRDEDELNQALHIKAERVIPVYTNNNYPFLKSIMFTQRDDLSGLSKREIYIHKTLNSNFFGKLIVLPDGEVKSSQYGPCIGSVDAPLHSIVYKELISDNSLWMRHRDKTECRDCRFRYLCPSISDYELRLKNNRLCWRDK